MYEAGIFQSFEKMIQMVSAYLLTQKPVERILSVGEDVKITKFNQDHSITVYKMGANKQNQEALCKEVNSRIKGRRFDNSSAFLIVTADCIEDFLLRRGFSYHREAVEILSSII